MAVLLTAGLLLLVHCWCPGVAADNSDKLNVHLVPHTHDDVGWLKTVDEYYYGANNSIQLAGVQYILDSVIDELAKDKDRKFIYVEIAFFMRWWREQSSERQQQVREMVHNKQLEFINAGWCMNDEASTHYNAIIDQMSLGLRFVLDNFGEEARPRIGWHIDPFGHSAVQASLFAMMGFDAFFLGRISYDDKILRLNQTTMEMVWRGSSNDTDIFTAINYNLYQPPPGFCYDSKCHTLDPPIQMGFDGFFFGRIDYDDKRLRLNHTTMEMVWRGSTSLQTASDIFTGVTYNGYGPPSGFCFDPKCQSPPIQDDPELYDDNVKNRVNAFIEACHDQAKHYKTNNIMLTMGSDFHYMNAPMWFKNMDKLMKYVRQNGSVNIMYSTPSIYLDALHEAGETWSVKTDDFFPYADAPWSYWTGYFTSRPALKGYVRTSNNVLQACKQLETIHSSFEDKVSSMAMQQAMGVAQHHDAISGTEKQHVADDYAKRLHAGQVECTQLMHEALNKLATKPGSPSLQLQSCEYLNISVCPATETNSFNMMVYNPLGRNWTGILRVPLSHSTVQVTAASDGKELVSQVIPVSPFTEQVRGKKGTAPYELVFSVDSEHSVPALGFATFFVRNTIGKQSFLSTPFSPSDGVAASISTKSVRVTFDSVTKRLSSITNLLSNLTLDVDHAFLWYNSSNGKNKNSSQASGAYIFRPNETTPFDVNPKPDISVVQGPLVNEVYQTFAPWLSQVVRVVPNSKFVEMEYTVGPIPFKDGLGKEIITRYTTSLKSNSVWYTDANGREMQRRVRNHRPTWKWNNTAPVTGNYYPVNSRIYIRDEDSNLQLTILNDRSQGGSSLNDGQVELMIHRRCLKDDGRGVAEPLNETGQYGDGLIIRGKHYVLVESIKESSPAHRMMAEQLLLSPHLSFDVSSTNVSLVSIKYNTLYAGLVKELPSAVHLLTLQYLDDDTVLIRLEHQFETGEGMDDDVTVSLQNMFTSLRVAQVTELVLGANAKLSDVERLKWKTTTMDGPVEPKHSAPVLPPSFDVQLSPMEIRTFEVKIERQ